MDISSQMLLFAAVVEHGSISAAARTLGQTPSAASKQITLLEDHVRYRLLNRTRTGVLPTQEGQEFYEKCKAMAEKFNEAEALILNFDGTPRGKLKVASTIAFGKSQLIPAMPRFLEAFPEVQVSLDLTDREIDLQAEGYDAAICFAEMRRSPDIMIRRIMHSKRVLCASPVYLEKWGTPTGFDDLQNHNCLRIAGGDDRNAWSGAETGDGSRFIAAGNFEGHSIDAVFHATLAGIGIARLPCYMTHKKVQAGELVQILPEHNPPGTDIAVIFPERRNLAPKTRVFIDFLVDQFHQTADYEMTG